MSRLRPFIPAIAMVLFAAIMISLKLALSTVTEDMLIGIVIGFFGCMGMLGLLSRNVRNL